MSNPLLPSLLDPRKSPARELLTFSQECLGRTFWRIDRDGVLWLYEERYERECSIDQHTARLPRGVCWYADPSGALSSDQR